MQKWLIFDENTRLRISVISAYYLVGSEITVICSGTEYTELWNETDEAFERLLELDRLIDQHPFKEI